MVVSLVQFWQGAFPVSYSPVFCQFLCHLLSNKGENAQKINLFLKLKKTTTCDLRPTKSSPYLSDSGMSSVNSQPSAEPATLWYTVVQRGWLTVKAEKQQDSFSKSSSWKMRKTCYIFFSCLEIFFMSGWVQHATKVPCQIQTSDSVYIQYMACALTTWLPGHAKPSVFTFH